MKKIEDMLVYRTDQIPTTTWYVNRLPAPFCREYLYRHLRDAGRIRLDPSVAFLHLQRTKDLHSDTLVFVEEIFPRWRRELDLSSNDILRWIQDNEGAGFQHAAGRIDLTLRAQDADVPLVWLHPDAHLDAMAVSRLVDTAHNLMERARGCVFKSYRTMQRIPKW